MYYIGKIVNTHGIKGEVKIISNIKHKDLIFKKGNIVIIENEKLTINSYRTHKNFDMITFKNINDINDVLKYKGLDVFIENKDSDIYLDEDYIGLDVYSDKYIGKIEDIMNNTKQDIFVIENNDKKYYVPDVFVKEIDIKNNKMIIEEIDGLIED